MLNYAGIKQVKAKPMTLKQFKEYMGEDSNGVKATKGYLVECKDGGESNHENHEGCISWSPQDVFEKAYKTSGTMGFEFAIYLLKNGFKVERETWKERAYLHLEDDKILAINTDGSEYIWAPHITDLLATDWWITG